MYLATFLIAFIGISTIFWLNSKGLMKSIDISKSDYFRLYEKELIVLEIKGIYFRNLSPKLSGFFFGKVICDYFNPYDDFAIEVLNASQLHLGYLPKGNMNLFGKLKKYFASHHFSWGVINFNYDSKTWDGIVFIPLGYSENEINIVRTNILLINERDSLLTQFQFTVVYIFKILELQKRIQNNFHMIKKGQDFKIELPSLFISSISIFLEKSHLWKELVLLDSYLDEIYINKNILPKSIFKRILKAKSNIP